MSKQPDIVVRGQAEARVMPDRALLTARVEETGATSEKAYATAAAITTAVDATLDKFGDDLSRVGTATLAVSPTTRWHKGETHRTGWRAQRATRIEVTNPERLGTLISELASAGATVIGPEWVVDRTNPAISELRRQAAADARTRASDYAAGLGVELGAVRWVAEPGLGRRGGGDPGFPVRGRAMMAAGGMRPESEPEIEVAPEEVDMALSVEVAFQIL